MQAIATARRLGAVVSAYDLRPAVKEQVQSLGGRFVELPIEAKDAQDAADTPRRRMKLSTQRQRELLAEVVAESDVVITAAVVPGKKSPVLVTAEMVEGMAPGSVIVDLAAERGGNCELTQAGRENRRERRHHHRLFQSGEHRAVSRQPDVRAQPHRVSDLLVKDGKLKLNLEDDIIREHAADSGRRSGEPARARIFLVARAGGASLKEESMPSDFISNLYVFILAGFVGFEVIKRVSPLLHTPLMSLTNALDAIVVVAAIIIAGRHETHAFHRFSALIAVAASFSNMVGGFLITDRMLRMFKTGKTKKS